jgi:6-pyruvoyltetrahydropterin/6-carboxytetrahydropterin synthase
MDLKRLKLLLEREVLADVDHANLNLDVDWLSEVIPTTENLAVAIWRRLERGLPGVTLVAVRLWETDRNSVEYRGQ